MRKYSVQETVTVVKHYIVEADDPDSAVWACKEGGSPDYSDPVCATFDEDSHWSSVEIVEVPMPETAARADD